MVVLKGDTIPLENLFVISDNVEEQTDQLGQMNPMTTINRKEEPKVSESLNLMTMMDGKNYDQVEDLYEDIEFDDESAIDYDIDFITEL